MKSNKEIVKAIEKKLGLFYVEQHDIECGTGLSVKRNDRTLYVTEEVTEELAYYDVLIELINTGIAQLDEYCDMAEDNFGEGF